VKQRIREPRAGTLRGPGAILLVSCYELGHQPLGLASPLGFLERAGYAPDARWTFPSSALIGRRWPERGSSGSRSPCTRR